MATTPRITTKTKVNSLKSRRAETQAHPASPILDANDSGSHDPMPALPFDQAFVLIKANVDVGLGNSLFIRGEGNGLSWDHGQPLACIDSTQWIWASQITSGQMTFKLLLNDQIWARGGNLVANPGSTVEFAPEF